MQFSGVLASSYLLFATASSTNGSDHFTSHMFPTLNMNPFYCKAIGKFLSDDHTDNFQLTFPTDDYYFRSLQLDSACLYEFQQQYYKKIRSSRSRNNCITNILSFIPPHPQRGFHQLIKRRDISTHVPLICGNQIPRQIENDATYCLYMLLLLNPHRHPSDFGSDIDLIPEQWLQFKQTLPAHLQKLVSNLQFLHKSSAEITLDQTARQELLKNMTTDAERPDLNSNPFLVYDIDDMDAAIDTLLSQYTPDDLIENFRSSDTRKFGAAY
ncbi:hypothetical protein BKA69DRAFT_1129810 [Paraphysoderma sedebokerense]|nr:hypothetical protein BKA69DRAFT_1129810 [Paraphysoderma sedebokerense]